MYNAYSEVPEQMIALREIVMARKEPRKLLIQPHMHASAEKVELQTFASTPTGMIESFVAVSGACTMTSTNRCCIV